MPNDSGHQPWKEYCKNKTEKQRQLDGQATGINSQSRSAAQRKKPKTTGDSAIQSLAECFAGMRDPRLNRQRRHLLLDIIVIAICAVICNADTWKDIHT